jgi:hypothetical protein
MAARSVPKHPPANKTWHGKLRDRLTEWSMSGTQGASYIKGSTVQRRGRAVPTTLEVIE